MDGGVARTDAWERASGLVPVAYSLQSHQNREKSVSQLCIGTHA